MKLRARWHRLPRVLLSFSIVHRCNRHRTYSPYPMASDSPGEKLNCAAMHDDKINLPLPPPPREASGRLIKAVFRRWKAGPRLLFRDRTFTPPWPWLFRRDRRDRRRRGRWRANPIPSAADFAAANRWQASSAKLPSPPLFFALFSARRRSKTVSRSEGGYCGRISVDARINRASL